LWSQDRTNKQNRAHPPSYPLQNKSAGAKQDDDCDEEEEEAKTLLVNSMVVELENEMPASHFKCVMLDVTGSRT